MRTTVSRLALLSSILLVSSTITCSDSPTAPKTGLRAIVGLTPTLSAAATDIYRNLVSFEFAVNNVRVRLARANGEIALDTVVAVAAGQDSIVLQLAIQLEGSQEVLEALIELRDGDQVLFSGKQTITARAGIGASPPPIELEYTGPGATAVSLDVEPDTTIMATHSVTMRPIARDANNQIVADLELEWSVSNASIGAVNATGTFTSSGSAGSTVITAILPTGITGSATVTVVSAAPSQLVLISGAGQTGTAGAALAQPIIVEVRSSNGLPVASLSVTFEVSSGNGSLSTSSTTTGVDGRASTVLTLGTTPGANSVLVTAAGLPPITVSATGTVGTAASIQATAPAALSITDTAGANLGTPALPSVVVRDAHGNFIPGVQVKFRRHGRAGGTINAQADTLVLVTTGSNGAAALNARRLQTPAGFDTVLVTTAGVNDTIRFAVTVTHASATQLVFLQQPTNANAGAVIAPPVTVEMRDQFGNHVTTGAGATTTVAVSLSNATISGTTSVAAVAGVATFGNLSVQLPGNNYQLLATASPLASATSAPFTIASTTSTVTWINAAGGSWSDGANWSTGVAPSTTSNVVIDLSGTYTVTLDVNATVGSLTLGGTSGAQTLAASSRTLTLNGASRISTNGLFSLTNASVTGSGTLSNAGLLITHGTTALDSPTAIEPSGTLRVQGQSSGSHATLTIANGFTNNGLIELTSIDAGYSATLTVTTGTLANASGATIRSAPGAGGARTLAAQLDNQGTLDVDQPLTLSRADAQHVNGGVIDLTTADLTLTQSGTSPTFTNTGAVTLGANRTFIVASGVLDLSEGTVSGQLTSTLVVTNATLDFLTTTVTIPLTLNSTAIAGGSISIPDDRRLTLLNGGLSDAVNVQAVGMLLIHGSVSLTGPVTSSGIVRVQGQGNGSHATATVANAFTNNGTIELTSIEAGYSATLAVTTGTLTNASGRPIRSLPGAGGARTLAAQLDNQGILDIDQPLTLAAADADHLNSGTIDLQTANLTLAQTGGTPSFINTGSVVLGTNRDWTVTGGTLDLSAGTVSGQLTSTLIASDASLAFSTSTVTVPMTLTATTIVGGAVSIPSGQTLTLLNGGLSDPVTVEAGGMLLTHGAVTLATVSMPTASSTLRVQGQGSGSHATLTVANGFTNSGLIELTSVEAGYSATLAVTTGTLANTFNARIHSNVGAGGGRTLAARLNNSGTLDVDHALTIDKADVSHYNSNLIDLMNANLTVIQTGTAASFGNGIIGSIVLGPSRMLTINGGAVNLLGSSTITGQPTSTMVVTDGVLQFTPPRVLVPLTLTNTTILGGSVTIGSGQTLTLLDGGVSDAVAVEGGTLVTHGTVTLAGPLTNSGGTIQVRGQSHGSHANLTVADGFTNNGTIELTSADAGYASQLTVRSGTLTNGAQSSIRSTQGSGGSRSVAAELQNNGSLEVYQALSLSRDGAVHQNAGSIYILASELTVTGASLTNGIGGILYGVGGLNVAGTSFTNHGLIDPGVEGPGPLNITGDYAQGIETGTLRIDVNGAERNDLLAISGKAALAGPLIVNLTFFPTNGQTFTILTASGGITGTFAYTPLFFDGFRLDIEYTETAVILRVVFLPQ